MKDFGAEPFDSNHSIWISMIVLQQNLETAFFWEGGGGSGGVWGSSLGFCLVIVAAVVI